MSANPAIVGPPCPARRLVSPVAFQKQRGAAEVLYDGGPRSENGHGPANNSVPSTPPTIAMPKIESCILGKETLEQREKLTVSNVCFDIAFSFVAHG